MKKKLGLLCCSIGGIILSSNVLAFDVETPPMAIRETIIPADNSNNIFGIIQWLGTVLSILLIIFAIIKTILMIKNKKPVVKIVIFDLIMILLICLSAYGPQVLSAVYLMNQ